MQITFACIEPKGTGFGKKGVLGEGLLMANRLEAMVAMARDPG